MQTQDDAGHKPENTQYSKGIGVRTFMLLCIIPTVFVLLSLLYVVTSSQIEIRQECQNMLLKNFPEMTEQQRTSVNIERMRQLGGTVLNTLDPSLRRKARIEAQGLTTDAAFEATAETRETIANAYETLRAVALLRDRQQVLRAQMVSTLTQLHSVQDVLFDRLIEKHTTLSATPLKDLHNTLWELSNIQDIRVRSVGADNLRLLLSRIDTLAMQSQDVAVPEDMRQLFHEVEHDARLFLNLYQEFFAMEDSASKQAQDFDIALRGLSESMTLSASQGIESMLQKIIGLAMSVERITWQGFMLLCACVIVGIFVLRICVYLPLLWIIRRIEALRNNTPEVPMPHILVRELRYLALCVTDLGYYFSRITAHTEQLESEKNIFEGLSTEDALTKLHNRRYFDVLLGSMWQQASRAHLSLTMLMMDVDNFKKYNDALGHPQGDVCLQSLGEAFLSTMLRPGDKVCRYGGEEFALLIKGANLQGALRVAKRIHEGVQRLALPHPQSDVSSFVTLSIGLVTLIPQEGEDPSVLVQRADRALYAAKSAGRNRTCVSTVDIDQASGESVEKFLEIQGGGGELAG